MGVTSPPTGHPDPNAFARALFGGLPDRYDLLAELLSLGQNRRWRRAMVDRVVAADPASVLDVATGTAGVAMQLAERTRAEVIGVDLTEAMVRRGRENALRPGRKGRVRFMVGRAEALPFPDACFDSLTFTYLLRYVADPQATLRELARVVRPGGVVASLEFHVPAQRFWRGAWWLYTRLGLPALGALAGRSWYEVGRFLGPSISRHYRHHPLAWQIQAWERAGLRDVSCEVMSLGGGIVMSGQRAGD